MRMEHLAGLVLCGGQSVRMGWDKGLLQYHALPQRYHVYEMLQKVCSTVFISCMESQAASVSEQYGVIADAAAYSGIGPMAGLLTAYDNMPGSDMLVVGCDYPYMNVVELGRFLASVRAANKPAAFFNPESGFYEPLLALYPARCASGMKALFADGQYSLQQFLRSANAVKYKPADLRVLHSIDTYPRFLETKNELGLDKKSN